MTIIRLVVEAAVVFVALQLLAVALGGLGTVELLIVITLTVIYAAARSIRVLTRQ